MKKNDNDLYLIKKVIRPGNKTKVQAALTIFMRVRCKIGLRMEQFELSTDLLGG